MNILINSLEVCKCLCVHMGLQAFYQCCAGVARFEAGTYTLVLVMLGQQRIC